MCVCVRACVCVYIYVYAAAAAATYAIATDYCQLGVHRSSAEPRAGSGVNYTSTDDDAFPDPTCTNYSKPARGSCPISLACFSMPDARLWTPCLFHASVLPCSTYSIFRPKREEIIVKAREESYNDSSWLTDDSQLGGRLWNFLHFVWRIECTKSKFVKRVRTTIHLISFRNVIVVSLFVSFLFLMIFTSCNGSSNSNVSGNAKKIFFVSRSDVISKIKVSTLEGLLKTCCTIFIYHFIER